MAAIYCYGCGKDITSQASNRYNMLSVPCFKALPIWKKMASERFKELNIEVDINKVLLDQDEEKCVGKMCRSCVSALQRLDKLEASTRQNINDAIDMIVSGGQWLYQSRKRSRPVESSDDETPPQAQIPTSTSHMDLSVPSLPSSISSHSPDVAVVVKSEKRQKMYLLTPRRKKAGKAIARTSMKKLVDECFLDERTHHYIALKIGRIVTAEIKGLSNLQSILCSQSVEDLKTFQFEKIYYELQNNASFLFSIFMSATKTKTPRENRMAVICVCTAVLLKYRFKRLNLFQKMLSLVLYAGHCSKLAFARLCGLELAVSHPTVIKLVESLGKDHDALVKEWRDNIITNVLDKNDGNIELDYDVSLYQSTIGEESDSDSLSETGSSSSSTDYSSSDEEPSLSFSPVTESDTDTEDTDGIDSDVDVMHTAIDTISSSEGEIVTKCPPMPPSPYFKIVGDNIDKHIKPRYMRTGHKGKSLHYFHSFAVHDRINVDNFSTERAPSCLPSPNYVAKSLLPTTSDDDVVVQNVKILFSRVLTETLPFFNSSFLI